MNAQSMDGVQMAVLNSRLNGIARKMANTLLRTGRSGVLNIARDFSCCIVTAGCELLAAAESLPIHVLSGPDMMARAMLNFHPAPAPGDAFLHNSPYHGCSHAADHTLLVPVHDSDLKHRFTLVVKAHQADIGNAVPTTYYGAALDVYAEGALIFPAVQVQRGYKDIEDITRMCRMRIRVPNQWWGDYLAMVGSARIGERELTALGAEVGWDVLDDFAGAWFDYSERLMIHAIQAMPSGEATRTSTHDPFPGTPETGIPVEAKVLIDAPAALIHVDLTNNMDALPCGLNLSEACARTSAMVGAFNSLPSDIPKNAGSFRRLKIALREGCVVGIPHHPTSTSVATTNVADRVANAVQCAMAEIADGAGLAECGAIMPPCSGVISGIHPKTGERFVNQLFLGLTGGAASAETDAWLTIGHVGNAGLIFIDSVELDELRQPLHVHVRRLLPDTEGAGRRKGASSLLVEFGPYQCDLSVNYVSDGAINGPAGIRGGLGGGRSAQSMVRGDGTEEALPSCAQILLLDGERVRSVTCGGGGYGAPYAREKTRVLQDVQQGLVSMQRARQIYGVAIDESGNLEEGETERLRTSASGSTSASPPVATV